MAKNVSAWEEAYRSVESLWGLKPDHVLVEYASLVPKGAVLDLGVGEGRNALFFARMGFEVKGIDISRTAVDRCVERARDANLRVKAEVGDLREVEVPRRRYSLVIAAWILNFFKKPEAEEIVGKMKNGLKKGGFVYVAMFSLDDPGYARAEKALKAVEENTFYSPTRDSFVHYFTREEVLSLFGGFDVIYCVEGTGLDLDHGEPHYHGSIMYMGKKLK